MEDVKVETTIEKYIHIEEDFEHCGYRCIVLVNAMCLRCGYVGVPKSHPDYKKSYEQIESKYYAHGGITYSDFINRIGLQTDDLWYFGFDCGHFGDRYAVDEAVEYGLTVDLRKVETFRQLNEVMKHCESRFVVTNDCSKDYVIEECISLAEQLKREENNNDKKRE